MCGGGGGGGYVPIENQSDEQLQGYGAPSQQEVGTDDYGNPIYSYDENYDSQLSDYNSAQAEIQRRQQVKDQLAAQAAERENILKAQREQAVEMERQQAEIVSQQQAQAAQLQAQQAERVAGIRTAGSAVTQSLQILGKQQAKQGPTASIAKKPGVQVASGRRSAANSLQIGSTGSTPGAGANLSV